MQKLLRHLLLASIAALLPATAAAFSVDTISVSEPRLLDNPMPALVAVPDAAADTSLRFPTVYLLHGYGGDHTNWLAKQPRIGELADRYGIVVVTPGAGNTWYFDAPGKPGQQVETFFIEALVPYIDANYPTIDSRAKRAISGLSMGGHGALRMATRHPQIFGAAASMSGGVDIKNAHKAFREQMGYQGHHRHPPEQPCRLGQRHRGRHDSADKGSRPGNPFRLRRRRLLRRCQQQPA